MGVFDQGYTQAVIDAARNPVERPPAGFLEAFSATWESVRREELSISDRQNFLAKVKDRNQKIEELTGEPLKLDLNEPGLVQPGQLGTTVERARLAAEKRIRELSFRHPEVKTDEEMEAEIVEESRRAREKEARVLGNTTFAGKVGSFTGAMAAGMTDPLVMATIPFGASISAGIVRTALTEAGIAALTEAAIQPFIFRYKKKLGADYSLPEALERIAFAGAGAGVFAGTLKAGGRVLSRLRKRPRIEGVDELLEAYQRNVTNPTQEQVDAAFVLGEYADTLRDSPFDLGDPAADMRHLEATAKALSDVESGRPVDVQEFVRGIEPREELRPLAVTDLVEGRLPKTIKGAEPPPPTLNQSLGQFVKNSGGVAIDKAKDLRGEFEALFESGGRKSGAVKRKAGLSPDEMAQRAHEAGFIDEPDPAILKEALERDLSGEKVLSIQGDRFERTMDLQLEREFDRWAEMEEAAYLAELEEKGKGLLAQEDVQIPTGELRERGTEIEPVTRSARELIEESDGDIKAADILQKCLLGG